MAMRGGNGAEEPGDLAEMQEFLGLVQRAIDPTNPKTGNAVFVERTTYEALERKFLHLGRTGVFERVGKLLKQ